MYNMTYKFYLKMDDYFLTCCQSKFCSIFIETLRNMKPKQNLTNVFQEVTYTIALCLWFAY